MFTGSDPRNRVFLSRHGPDVGLGLGPRLGSASAAPDSTKKTGTETEIAAARSAYRDGRAQVSLTIYRCAKKPVVAALNGHAVGWIGIYALDWRSEMHFSPAFCH